MEGNECYKYRTLVRFLQATGGAPIRSILEVGANVGAVTRELAMFFPEARIVAYEMLEGYAAEARKATASLEQVSIRVAAVTCCHLFEDDLGTVPRQAPVVLHAYQALPHAGPGYEGGSFVGVPQACNSVTDQRYAELSEPIPCLTLDEAIRLLNGTSDAPVGYLKTDCEGAECSFLGCAPRATLEQIQYMAGEYHDFRRFWPVAMKLMETHFVNLIGDAALGAFFCERQTSDSSLLRKQPFRPRMFPDIHSEPLSWHRFDERWVPAQERIFHGLNGG